MSKTKRLVDFFFEKSANYITRTLHGTQHGPRGTFPWWSLQYPWKLETTMEPNRYRKT